MVESSAFVSFVFWLSGELLWVVFGNQISLSFRRPFKSLSVSLSLIISLWPKIREVSMFSMSVPESESKSSSIWSSVISGSVKEGVVVIGEAKLFMVGVVLWGFWVIRLFGFKEAGFWVSKVVG